MNLTTLATGLRVYERDTRLLNEVELTARRAALDHIAFAEAFVQAHRHSAEAGPLRSRLEALKGRLAAVDAGLFARLRSAICVQHLTPQSLRLEFERYSNYARERQAGSYVGPDGLDRLLDGILGPGGEFAGRAPADPHMVHYEPVPARVILELIDRAAPAGADRFCDLGAGLGRVTILYHLLTGLPSAGVEIDPEMVDHARRAAAGLRLDSVSFVSADAREAGLAHYDLFFMFTPFMGPVLQAVLNRLHQESRARPITVCTFGACSQRTAEQAWLTQISGDLSNEFSLIVFRSR